MRKLCKDWQHCPKVKQVAPPKTLVEPHSSHPKFSVQTRRGIFLPKPSAWQESKEVLDLKIFFKISKNKMLNASEVLSPHLKQGYHNFVLGCPSWDHLLCCLWLDGSYPMFVSDIKSCNKGSLNYLILGGYQTMQMYYVVFKDFHFLDLNSLCICWLLVSFFTTPVWFEVWSRLSFREERHYPPDKAYLKMFFFLFPRWDMLVPWRVFGGSSSELSRCHMMPYDAIWCHMMPYVFFFFGDRSWAWSAVACEIIWRFPKMVVPNNHGFSY